LYKICSTTAIRCVLPQHLFLYFCTKYVYQSFLIFLTKYV
jgi:hypothetical protein